jgi:hypothetical protein
MSPPGKNPLPRATLPELIARALGAWTGSGSGPDAADLAWAGSILTPAEFDLWSGQSAHDQRHTIQVARRVELRLASTAHAGDALWTAVALMHDVGKRVADLSLPERVVATLAARVVSVDRARRWLDSRGKSRRRFGRYLLHGEVGAGLIRKAGGREPIAAWTEVHQGYGRLEEPGLPAVVVEALIESDAA